MDKLLELAKKSMAERKITLPADDCVYYYYSEILKISPDHKKAKAELKKVVPICIVQAEKEIKQLKFPEARRYVEIGLSIDPSNKKLLSLRKKASGGVGSYLGGIKDSMKDSIKSLFKSGK